MLTTNFVSGSPNWIDLGTSDVDAAASFYGALFGWEFRSAGPEAGGYGMFTLDGKTVAAAGPLMELGASPAWTPFFHTDDAETTAKTVEQAGGTVRLAPMDVFTAGRMAAFADPTGARFSVWQPGDTKGLDAVNDPNTLCWTELFTTDPARAKTFYHTLFGWDTKDMAVGDGENYALVMPADGSEGSMQGGMMGINEEMRAAGVTSRWHPYFEVVDCDAVVAEAAEKGATVMMPPESAEGIGRMSLMADPAGAPFAVIASAPSRLGTAS